MKGSVAQDSRQLTGRWKEEGGAEAMGRTRSWRSQWETLRFPKKPVKPQIILSKIVATRRAVDRAGDI